MSLVVGNNNSVTQPLGHLCVAAQEEDEPMMVSQEEMSATSLHFGQRMKIKCRQRAGRGSHHLHVCKRAAVCMSCESVQVYSPEPQVKTVFY